MPANNGHYEYCWVEDPVTRVPEWHMFAYCNGEEQRDVHRRLAEWQIEERLRWAASRGYDCIMFTRTGRTAEFTAFDTIKTG